MKLQQSRDLAALAAEVYETARESIAHTVEQTGGSRVELFAELDRVALEAREACLVTTAVRSAALNARRS